MLEFFTQNAIGGIPLPELLGYWILGLAVLALAYNWATNRSSDIADTTAFQIFGAAVLMLQSLSILFCGYAMEHDAVGIKTWFGPVGFWPLVFTTAIFIFVMLQHLKLFFNLLDQAEERTEMFISPFLPTAIGLAAGAVMVFIGMVFFKADTPGTLTTWWNALMLEAGTGPFCIALGIAFSTIGIVVQLILYIISLRHHLGFLGFFLVGYLLFVSSLIVLLIPAATVLIPILAITLITLPLARAKARGRRSGAPSSATATASTSAREESYAPGGCAPKRCGDCRWYDGGICENSYVGYGTHVGINRHAGDCYYFERR